MGSYLNPGNSGFSNMRNDVYVDKTEMISLINQTINTPRNLTCISRPRRFGKSFAAKMLCAYYDKTCNSKELFDDLKIAKDDEYLKYLNQYDVIYLDMASVLGVTSPEDAVSYVKRNITEEVLDIYPEVKEAEALFDTLANLVTYTGNKIIMIIDEWDAPIRDNGGKAEIQREYLLFLRSLFKNSGTTDKIFAAVYMTGILPIKKDGSQSAISDFEEFTMVKPRKFAPYVGFTETEVQKLCEVYGQRFEEVKRWYDGYQIGKYHVYNPNAVVNLMLEGEFQSYWSGTASYEAIVPLINMDFDGLKSAVIEMLSGDHVPVDVTSFQNDTVSFANKDDVLTYLIHLGYLAYDRTFRTAFIPNEEIRQELILATKRKKWNELIVFQKESEQLLKDTIQMNGNAVAKEIEKIHMEYTSVIQYNNENLLSSVLSIAYLSSMQYYFKPIREFPAGRGFADFVFIPKPEFQNYYPALVVELKWDKSVRAALDQIRDRKYPESVACYAGELLLVGINYNEKTKEHECRIEKYEK